MPGIALEPLPSSIATDDEFYLHSCEVALLHRNPFMGEVFEAHSWAKTLGQNMSDMYPSGIPAIIVRAVIALDHGLRLAEYERIKKVDTDNGGSSS